jgi:ABC-type bacteriocin/lantibiotic exporter with double-glycine peptidase domain
MKNNKLSGLTLEELYKRKKTLQGAAIGFGIVMVIAFCILLYLVFQSRKFGLIAIIPAGFMTLLPAIIGLSQVNTEIKSRKSN